MNSDTFKFGSMSALRSGTVISLPDSDSEFEMVTRNEGLKFNKVSVETQTLDVQIIRYCDSTDTSTQTDSTFELLSPNKKQMQEMVKEQKRKLQAEREESLNRLKKIEKRLTKTEQTSMLFDSDNETTSQNSEDGVLIKRPGKKVGAKKQLYTRAAGVKRTKTTRGGSDHR